MNILRSIVWCMPFILLAAGFFTSRITAFRLTRYGFYFGVLFCAFLFDLQSTSFRIDKIDILFALLVLFVLSDFFWRVVRSKHLWLRIAALVTGLALFSWNYHEWIIIGPKSLNRLWNSKRLSEFKTKHGLYYVKQRCPEHWRKSAPCDMVLLKTRITPFLEQRLDKYPIPEGYENSTISLVWDTSSQSVSVQMVGDNDTLWTLGDPISRE
ncbi:MAG: hypothetical protein JW913_05720 [Chitinispirillaceae bacterium]|nr:hypothetical protein [Chitinispirillaceae bacterium]